MVDAHELGSWVLVVVVDVDVDVDVDVVVDSGYLS
jgi:hypothetical protein